MIDVKIFNVTVLMTNCCLLTDRKTGHAVYTISDPREKILKSYAKQLAEKFDAKIVTGEKNNEFLSNPALNLTEKHRLSLKPFSADILLKDGDNFMLGNTEIKYITTPGHTSGCGSYIFDDTIISVDTLFCESYGRTDLPTGDDAEMAKSIRKLKNLEGDYRVIPGHGPTTTLDHERKYNPLMRIL